MLIRRRSARLACCALAAGVVNCLGTSEVQAQVTRVEIISRTPDPRPQPGAAGPYEILRGRVHGELDPSDPHNTIIQDIQLAPRNAHGKVEYIATFALAKPIDMSKASGVLVFQ